MSLIMSVSGIRGVVGETMTPQVAANVGFAHPLKMFSLIWKGLRTTGDFAPEIDLSQARPPEEHHERIVGEEMAKLRGKKAA